MLKLYLIVFRADMKSYVSQYEWQGHRTGTSRSDKLNIAPERLAESVWCSKSSLLNINFRLSEIQTSLLLIYFSYGPTTCSHCNVQWKKTYFISNDPIEIVGAQIYSVRVDFQCRVFFTCVRAQIK